MAQVAYADRLVLNKCDLVTPTEADALTSRLTALNGLAPIVRATKATVPTDWVLGVGGYDLERIADALEGEGVGAVAGSASAPAHGEPGHVCGGGCGHDHEHDMSAGTGTTTTTATSTNTATTTLTGHEHASAATPHASHDDSVSSVSLTIAGDMDLAMVNSWLGALIEVRADDLYRFKGILSIAGYPNRYVVQGVHALFAGGRGRRARTACRCRAWSSLGGSWMRTCCGKGLRGV